MANTRMASPQCGIRTGFHLVGKPRALLSCLVTTRQATEHHPSGSPHQLSGDAGTQPEEHSALAGAGVTALEQISCWVEERYPQG